MHSRRRLSGGISISSSNLDVRAHPVQFRCGGLARDVSVRFTAGAAQSEQTFNFDAEATGHIEQSVEVVLI